MTTAKEEVEILLMASRKALREARRDRETVERRIADLMGYINKMKRLEYEIDMLEQEQGE